MNGGTAFRRNNQNILRATKDRMISKFYTTDVKLRSIDIYVFSSSILTFIWSRKIIVKKYFSGSTCKKKKVKTKLTNFIFMAKAKEIAPWNLIDVYKNIFLH